MRKILSKKLVPAIVISGISLQFIPFNVFAANSLSSKTAIATTNVSDLSGLAKSKIDLWGEYSGSNPEKVEISFDTEHSKIKLYKSGAMVNSHFRNKDYITVELFNESGILKKSFKLKGEDYPRVSESIKKFEGQRFEIGDYLVIHHAEPQNNVRIFGEANGNKSNTPRKDFTKETLDNSIIKITNKGLSVVKKQTITELKQSYWTNDKGLTMTGEAGTNFGKSDNKKLFIKGSNGVTETINIKNNEYDGNEFNVEIPSTTLDELKPGTYDLDIGFDQNGTNYTQPLKYNSMQSKAISDKFYLNSSYCKHENNKCRLSYQLISDESGSVKLDVKLKECYCNNQCECLK